MKEEILLFGKTQSLVGIIHKPQVYNNQLPAVILLNAGLIHRVGPNRLYVKIARALSKLGFVVFRFDFSGTGDSKARDDYLPLEQSVISEIQEAMSHLSETMRIEQFILIGHCSGAGLSFLTACQDSRVRGAVLINLQGGGEDWRDYDRDRKMAQYYTNYYGKAAITDFQRWARFLKGDVDYRSIARNVFQSIIWNRLSTLSFRIRRLSPVYQQVSTNPASDQDQKVVNGLSLLAERGVPVLFVYSEGNTGLDYLRTTFAKELNHLLATETVKLEVIPESDHLFTLLASQKHLLEVIQNWVRAVQPLAQEIVIE